MKRSEQREQAFFLIFESLFNDNGIDEAIELYSEFSAPVNDYAKKLYNGVCGNKEDIDRLISQYLNGWKINRISRVSLAVLRLAIYEIKYTDDVPVSVAINEAVELAKKYAGQEESSFVNGLLGSVVRSS